jgi:hypothetical protein
MFDQNQKSVSVRLREGATPNSLLAAAIGQVEVHSFTEHLPGMQEIFIRLVSDEVPAL